MIRITEKGLKEMEDFKRPDHPDFMTSQELKEMEFSGIRDNAITNERELWAFGDIRIKMSLNVIMLNPSAWEAAYEESFKLYNVKTLGE